MRLEDKKSNQIGFTLIELLVVISVIGTLASIVLVNMGGVRHQATVAQAKTFASSIQQNIGIDVVGAWDFDEESGAVAKDGSGNGNDGNFINSPVRKTGSECVFGNCLQFNGSNTYINCGTGTSMNIDGKSFTLEAWIKPAANIATNSRFTVLATYSPGWIVDLVDDADVEGYRFYNGATAYKYTPSGNEISLKWTHWVVTRNMATGIVKMYLNGEMKRSWSVATVAASANPLLIGRRSDGLVFNGLIDNVRIYSESIIASEVERHYLAGMDGLLRSNQITKTEYNERTRQSNKKYGAAE